MQPHIIILCLFDECPGICTIFHTWQHTAVVHISLQADGEDSAELPCSMKLLLKRYEWLAMLSNLP